MEYVYLLVMLCVNFGFVWFVDCLFVCSFVCLVFTVFPTINKKELDISMKRGVMFIS